MLHAAISLQLYRRGVGEVLSGFCIDEGMFIYMSDGSVPTIILMLKVLLEDGATSLGGLSRFDFSSYNTSHGTV